MTATGALDDGGPKIKVSQHKGEDFGCCTWRSFNSSRKTLTRFYKLSLIYLIKGLQKYLRGGLAGGGPGGRLGGFELISQLVRSLKLHTIKRFARKT